MLHSIQIKLHAYIISMFQILHVLKILLVNIRNFYKQNKNVLELKLQTV